MGLKPDLSQLRPPEKLQTTHQLEQFNSGNVELDDWLKRRALKNEASGASRTYVVCIDQQVVGYYCLATGAVDCAMATGRVRRNMPNPIPVIIIGRLAVDQAWQGQGLGRALLRDAILRILNAAEIAGIRAILVHATEAAKQFYEKSGFSVSPCEPMTLMVTVQDAISALERS